MATYAKIDMTYTPGTVVRVQIINSTDYMDPTFTWVDITNLSPQPFEWCSYNGTNFSNVIAAPYISSIPVDIPVGSQTTFTPFTLSSASNNFPVSIDGSNVSIGCQTFDYVWLRYAAYTLINKQTSNLGFFSLNSDGSITHNNTFNIAAIDVNLIYTNLCTLVSNFSAPPASLTPLEILENQSMAYRIFGTQLYEDISNQVWAANELAASQGNPLTVSQIMNLLSESTSLQQCLESGSLISALQVIQELVNSFPEYSAVGTYATNSINAFIASNPITS